MFIVVFSGASKAESLHVTVRKTFEPTANIPASVTAFSAAQIERQSIDNPTTLAQKLPGLSFNDPFGRFNPAPSIRGLIQPGLGDDPSVGFFADGQYISGRSSINATNFDLARIEVAKGPQSALFGRNSFGGAIQAISQLPSAKVDRSVSGKLSAEGDTELRAVVSGPLSDTFFARLALFEKTRQDPFSNLLASGPEIGQESTLAGRLSLRYNPSPERDVILRFNHSNDRDTQPAGFLVATNCGPRTGDGVLRLYCGTLPKAAATYAANDVVPPGEQGYQRDHTRLNLEWRENLHPSWQWHSLLGAAYEDSNFIRDDDYAAGQGARAGIDTARRDWQFDSRLLIAPEDFGTSGLIGISGYFFDNRTQRLDQLYSLGQTQPGGARVYNTTDSYALYGRLTQPITAGWRAEVEGRYQWEEKTLQSSVLDLSGRKISLDDNWQAFTPKFTLAHQDQSEGLLWYGSAAKGYKTGGFNDRANIFDNERVFAPEENWTYELGAKNIPVTAEIVADAGVFWIDWQDQQVLAYSSAAATNNFYLNNAARTTVRGVEFGLNYRPDARWQFGVNYAYTDARFDQYNDPDLRNIAGFTPSGKVDGNRLPRYSPHQVYFDIAYEQPLPDSNWQWLAGGDFSYKSAQYTDNSNTAETAARGLLNLRSGLQRDDLYMGLFVLNALDDRDPNVAIPWTDGNAGFRRAWLVVPETGRMMGVEARLNF